LINKINNKISVGIIGKNFGYNVIYKALLKNKLFKVKSFCFREKKNIPSLPKNIKIFTDWKKIIKDKSINAIIISKPPFIQKKILSFAIKNNKHIFCEKPCTKSEKELSQVLKLLSKKNSFVSHMVNYTIAYLPAFQFLKKKILEKNIIIKEAELEWIIFNKSNNINWKNYHDKGGGILFNFYCHTLYYLELLFGNMHSTKVDINNKVKSKNNYVIGDIVFSSGLKVKIKILIGDLNKHKKSIHQLKVQTLKNEQFVLSSSTKNLSDQFQLHKIKNIKNLKYKKPIFTSKILKKDFRISPTLFNLKRFAASIHKKKIDRSSFFTANHIHSVINKSIISSKKKKRIIIN